MLNRWIKRPEPVVKSPAVRSVYAGLYNAQRAHHLIDVRIEGVDELYQSIIIDIDPHSLSLTIDELFPAGFIALPGQKVVVSVREGNGHRREFESEVLEAIYEGSDTAYRLQLPSDLTREQRRSAYRHRVARRDKALVSFEGPDGSQYSGQVRDISATGISLSVAGSRPGLSVLGSELAACEIQIGRLKIDCDLRIRHSTVPDDDGAGRTQVGAEFLGVDRYQQRRIERYVTDCQRGLMAI